MSRTTQTCIMFTYQTAFLTLLSLLCLTLCLPGLSCTEQMQICLPAFTFQFKSEETMPSLLLQHAISMVSFITMDFSPEPVSPVGEHNVSSHKLLLNTYGYGLQMQDEPIRFFNARGLDIILVSMHVIGTQLSKIVSSPQPLGDAFAVLYDAAIDFASDQTSIQPALKIRKISTLCRALTTTTLVLLLLLIVDLIMLSTRKVQVVTHIIATTLATLAFVTSLACGMLLFTLILSLQRIAKDYATVTIGCGSVYLMLSTACIGITAVMAGIVTVQIFMQGKAKNRVVRPPAYVR